MRHFTKIWILLAIAAYALAGCYGDNRSEEYMFTLYNNSEKVIGWYIPVPSHSSDDTETAIFPKYKPLTIYNQHQHISPGGKYSFLEFEIPEAYKPDDAVKLYIFSVETLTEYTWEQIRADNLYEYCFELKVDELKAAGRKIYYPAQ
ncbi:MAG: hypothetical protein K2J62_05200 [Bacteroidales bacterium]|nr:hypothetical protein [Bacteroidales bacterium]